MSSTNRGGKRTPADNYPTPSWCVHRLLEDDHARPFLPSGEWLEPGAGDGSVIRAVNQVRSDISWTALEVRKECKSDLAEAVGAHGKVIIDDLLDNSTDYQLGTYAVALGNPPYRLAAEFIERSLQFSHAVVLLLRVNFLASDKRNSFMKSNPPDCYVLPNRPSFRGLGTDSPEYAWFVWSKEFHNRVTGSLRILKSTPRTERNSAKRTTLLGMGKRDLARQVRKKRVIVGTLPEIASSDVSVADSLPIDQGQ